MSVETPRYRLVISLLLLISYWLLAARAVAQPVDFASDVAPILKQHCYECHGPTMQESNYRLDVRDAALRSADLGVPSIVRGQADVSPLFQFVSGTHEDGILMPPDDEARRLNRDELAILKRWIDQGAHWPDEFSGNANSTITTDHWSFQPLANVSPPVVKSQLAKTAIDAFVISKLHDAGLEISGPADRITWIRRVYLDMHGLPPTARTVAAFVNDRSPEAFSRVIDAVLGSTHYGERWARHWLDVARFGESTGYEVNRDRENAFYYRDYVIDALNSDKPYRDFIIDQLAGDVAGDEIGTGFLVGGPYDLVKSPDVNLTLMQRQDELADYVNTTGTAFLAMTVGCARCHNHKFDPIRQKDFYAMQAVFAGVQHGERALRGAAANDVNLRIEATRRTLDALEKKISRFRNIAASQPMQQGEESLLPPVNARLNVEKFNSIPAKFVRFTINATNGAEPCIDELEVFAANDNDGQNVALASLGAVASASGTLSGYAIHRLEHVNDGNHGNSHSWISDTAGGGWVQIELPAPVEIDRIQWSRDREGGFRDRLVTSYRIEVATEPLRWHTVASSERRVQYVGSTTEDDSFIDKLPPKQATAARKAFATLQVARARIAELRSQIPTAYIGNFTTPGKIHRLHRGDPMSPREPVDPDALSVISSLGLSQESSESDRRLALAKWIASPDNPLTARVIVNRVWHYHFGTGLVATPSDFGKNGALPSHPQLLDWMAQQFMKNGWSLKWLHREILSSHVYQQSSTPRAEAIAKDADSRLLWRYPPRRLEAEAIRDCALHVSGALNLEAGGPGFLLFDIDHENVHHYFPKNEFGPEEFRRMVYMTKIRQEQDGVFGVFDCPDGGQTIPSRSRSTTPLQALNLLNSKFMLQQAEILATRIRNLAGDHPGDQVEQAFRLVFSRPPDGVESEMAKELVDEFGLRALCRALFNANEFLFLN